MKKSRAVVLALLLAVLCAGCRKAENVLPHALGVVLTDSTVAEHWDDHGAMSDGTEYWRIELSQKDAATLEKQAQTGEGWHPLPVNEDVEALLYGREWQEDSEVFGAGPYLTQQDGNPLLPQVEEGYWFFYDDQTESYETAGVLDRHSYNFTAAVYDKVAGVLYCGEMDT